MDKRLRLGIKGTIEFLAVFAILVWMWSFFRSYLLFMAILLMISGVILSVAVLWHVRGKIGAEFVLPRHRVGKNTDIPVEIRFVNPLRFAGFAIDVTCRCENLFTGSVEEKKEKLWAAPRKGGRLSYRLNSRYAGQIRVTVTECRVYDFLHLFYLTDREAEDGDVLVWTAFADGEDAEESDSSIEGFLRENESVKRGVEYNPDYELREYIPGDELKNIHWKLSAKQDTIMVRERLTAGREKVNVLLPLGDNPDENDALMESLYGMCRRLLSKEYPVQLFWQGVNRQLCSRYIVEAGELENVLGELLSTNGIRVSGSIEEQMSLEHPAERYVLVRTGAYKDTRLSGRQSVGPSNPPDKASLGVFSRKRYNVDRADVMLVKLPDAKRYDFWAALTRTFLLFLIVYGAVGGFLAAFEIAFHSGFCMLALFALAFVLSAVDETEKRWLINLTSLGVFLLYALIAATNYWIINNGYYYTLNRIFDVARTYFGLSGGMEYSLIIEDAYLAITVFAIFLGMVGIILLHIKLHNKCTLFQVMLLTLTPYVIPMYLECSPPFLQLSFLLTGYAVAAMLSYGRGRVSRQVRYMLPVTAAAVIFFVRSVAFLLPESSYNGIVPPGSAKEASKTGMERVAQYGMSSLFSQNAVGTGVSGGRLSKASAVMPRYETALLVRYTPYSLQPVYLKGFTGVDYIGTSWTEAQPEWPEDGDMEMSVYSRRQQFKARGGAAVQGRGVMEVERIGGEASFEYRPYYTDYDEIEEKDGALVYRYYPDSGNTSPTLEREPYIRYLNVPQSCEAAVRRICAEADFGGTEEEIARQLVTYFDENYNYTLRPGFYYGNPDYISHFLLESKKGYCAHFASAATMLFRQMGIPARYVEGYAFSYADVVENGELVEGADYDDYYEGFSELGETALIQLELPEARAHAWVEIFDSERGWIVVDPTPPLTEEETASFWDVFTRGGGVENAPELGENLLGEYIENAFGIIVYVLLAAFLIVVISLAAVGTIRGEKERRLPGRERVRLEYGRLQRAAAKKSRQFLRLRTLREQLAWMRENCRVEITEEQEEALYQAFFAEELACDCDQLCGELKSKRRQLYFYAFYCRIIIIMT